MHVADILSRLAGKDLEPSDQLIPISFNVHTRSTKSLKFYHANKHKMSSNIPYITKTTTPKSTQTKTTVVPTKPPHPPKVQPYASQAINICYNTSQYLLVSCGNHFHQNSHHHRKR